MKNELKKFIISRVINSDKFAESKEIVKLLRYCLKNDYFVEYKIKRVYEPWNAEPFFYSGAAYMQYLEIKIYTNIKNLQTLIISSLPEFTICKILGIEAQEFQEVEEEEDEEEQGFEESEWKDVEYKMKEIIESEEKIAAFMNSYCYFNEFEIYEEDEDDVIIDEEDLFDDTELEED